MPNFKLKCGDSENMKAGHVSTIVFKLHQIKRRAFFFGGGGGEGDTRYVKFLLSKRENGILFRILFQENCCA